VWAFAFTHLFAAAWCFGVGAATNHFYDAMIAVLIAIAFCVPELERYAATSRHPQALFAVLLLVPFFLTSVMTVPQRLYGDSAAHAEMAQKEAEFAFVAKAVGGYPGPALCETLLICYTAGKPEEYDAYGADMAFRTGHLAQSEQVALITGHHFKVIQLEGPSAQPLQPAPRIRFSGPVMRALFASYQLVTRTDQYAVFVPR
jgi:hypothetical protein